MSLSPDSKKKITYMNRRRRPANVVLLSPPAGHLDSADENRGDSSAPSSCVFVSPMSAQEKSSPSTGFSAFPRDSPHGSHSVQSPSFTHPARNSAGNSSGGGALGGFVYVPRPRPSPLMPASSRDDVAMEPGELSLSASSNSISVHRRPSQDQPRNSTASTNAAPADDRDEKTSSSYAGNDAAGSATRPSLKVVITPPAALQGGVNAQADNGPLSNPAPAAAAAITASPSLTSTSQSTPAAGAPSSLVVSTRPVRNVAALAPTRLSNNNNNNNNISNNSNFSNANSISVSSRGGVNGFSASPEPPLLQLTMSSRQMSYQSLESPQDPGCVSDLGVSREGVDWERVDADPRELFRQRNVVQDPVLTRQSTKSNDEVSLNGTANTIGPDPPTVTSTAPRSVIPAEAAPAPAAAAVAPTATRKASAPDVCAARLGGTSPAALTTPVPNLKHPQTSWSLDSSAKPESAPCDLEDPIDIEVEDGDEEVEDEGELDSVNLSSGRVPAVDTTALPSDEDSTRAGKMASLESILNSTKVFAQATAATTMTTASASSTTAAATAGDGPRTNGKVSDLGMPKEGEVNIFVAVRIRPCTEAGGAKHPGAPASTSAGSGNTYTNNNNISNGSAKSTVSCVRADPRRGFVDCSTIAAASVLVNNSSGNNSNAAAGANNNSSANGGSATAGSAAMTGDPSETGAGKRTRTLRFFFDHILDEHVAQRDVMEQIGQRAVARVLAGYHGTVMCYGQSGSGKTYTIVGPNGGRLGKKALRWTPVNGTSEPSTNAQSLAASISSAPELSASQAGPAAKEQVRIASDVGLLPRMLQTLFDGLEARRLESDSATDGVRSGALASWSVTFSALELYNEELRDLLPHALDKKRTKKAKRKKAAPAAASKEQTDGEEEEEVNGGGEAAKASKVEVKSPITLSRAPKGRAAVNTPLSNPSPKKTRNETAQSSSASASASHASFPTYPGLFPSLNGTGKTSMENTRCWNAEDLDVLNAVSSSDDDDEDSDIDSDSNSSSGSEDGRRDAEGEASGRGQAGSPNTTEHTRELPRLPGASPQEGENEQEEGRNDKADGNGVEAMIREDEGDGEPDPSRPTTNAFTAGSVTDTARGRMTIGQLTSVSPSPPRNAGRNTNNPNHNHSKDNAGSAAAKKQVVVVDVKAGHNNNNSNSNGNAKSKGTSTPAAGATAAPTATTAGAIQTRIARRLPHGAASKSPSPLQKPQTKAGSGGSTSNGASAGGSPLTRSGTRASTFHHHNSSSTNNTLSGGSQLVIRQGQPSTSPTAKTPPPFESATRNSSSRAASTKSRSKTRPRGHAKEGEEAVYIEGLREHPMHDLHDAMRAVRLALHHRQMASTELNTDSSRAHTFFFVRVEQRQWRRRTANNNNNNNGGKEGKSGKLIFDVRRSTLTLVDLAGSERVSHTGAHGLRLKEAQNINLSLSALGNVMRLLSGAATAKETVNDAHIPYRDSKLTRILQSSLGGNAITFLLCNVSPDHRDAFETMSTLRFAKLSKAVKNKAKLNETVDLVDDDDDGDIHNPNSAVHKATAALVEKYKKEQKAALTAVLTAESKLQQMVGDAAQMRDRMRQMATYAWWLEDQLGYFANNGLARAVGADNTPAPRLSGIELNGSAAGAVANTSASANTSYPTVLTLPTSLTNPTVGDMRSGEGNSSSVGPLSDTEQTTNNLNHNNNCNTNDNGSVAAAGTNTTMAEKVSEMSMWWKLSPRPLSPNLSSPAATAGVTNRAGTAGATSLQKTLSDGNSAEGKARVIVKENPNASLTSPLSASQAGSTSQYWQSPCVRSFLSPSYSLMDRQREMQRRLVAAAAAAGVAFAFPELTLAPQQPTEQQQLQQQQQAQSPNLTRTSQALSPYLSPANPVNTTTAAATAGNAAGIPHSPQLSVRESWRLSGENVFSQQPQQQHLQLQHLQDPNVDSRRINNNNNALSCSGVFVSESSMAEAYSPCLSVLTDGQQAPTQRSLHSPASFQRNYPSTNLDPSSASPLLLSHSNMPSAPSSFAFMPPTQSSLNQQQQPQQHQQQPVSNFAVALAEERRARATAQARVAEVERQNILLRLRLAALQAQQREQDEERRGAFSFSSPPGTRNADGSPSGSEIAVTAAAGTDPLSLAVAAAVKEEEEEKKKTSRRSGVKVLSASSDATPSLLTPSSPPQFRWPPHYTRAAQEASLETFLARCGFVPLDGVAESPFALPSSSSHAASFEKKLQQLQQLQQQQQQLCNPMDSHLSSPSDAHSLRSITVNPSSMQAFREGSAARAERLHDADGDPHATADEDDGRRASDHRNAKFNRVKDADSDRDDLLSGRSSLAAATNTTRSTTSSSVLAVVNASMTARSEHPLDTTPMRPTRNAQGGLSAKSRGSAGSTTTTIVHRRAARQAVDADSPDASPRARSPGWGQQLLDSVRTTLETVRAMSSHETFYEPDDMNSTVM